MNKNDFTEKDKKALVNAAERMRDLMPTASEFARAWRSAADTMKGSFPARPTSGGISK